MNAATLAWRALRHKPLASSLNLLLVAIGIAMMTFILGVSSQLEEHAERDAQGIDLVVGAKGSPLQLILSSVYHADIPTGNIPDGALAALAAQPLVKSAIPLALGDNFHGFRIVGSTTALLDHYGAHLAQGKLFTQAMQAVFGARAARDTGATLGASFAGSHGLAAGGEVHEHAPYTVTGILAPTGTVLDRLILTPVASVWQVHETDPDEQPALPAAAPERELTAVLVQYASPLAAISLPRWVNSQARLQAAQPAFEAARLFNLLGVGIDVLRAIAAGVLLVAALSLFVALYGALEERKTDLAILRTLGASPAKLLRLLLAQGLLLSLTGAALGWLLGHAAVGLLGWLASMQDLNLQAWRIVPGEAWLPVIAVAVGLLAAAIPAARAYRTDIAATLARP
ncbi:FtsX-like permease family protein [Janthinobacterium lividum]|uniref:FtsX-like permease family protein n=1 Tax=Janthinobacterium lividum TaxID=29581 RepID=A0ABU0XM55_9BURK|nr:FtsX-like permease family protein [Janthinobacterium lividum]MDQ4624603.1 FtsX-like permease family protein [Janthinobacterium lividum]MDQ4673793.1 FtsX-like permease family protein [Janthinobacterium lividum]MDQ4684523.1 FtsX-like permease family protein [Janthinobacterium lividum]